MQSNPSFNYPESAPASYLFFLRAKWFLSNSEFLCTPTLSNQKEFLLSSKKYFATTAKLRHFSTFISLVADVTNEYIRNADEKREALMKKYRFVSEMKKLMEEYNVQNHIGAGFPIFELNYSDALRIDGFCDDVYGSMKKLKIMYSQDEASTRFDANLNNLIELNKKANDLHRDVELLLDMAFNPSSMDNAFNTKNLFDGFFDGLFDVIETCLQNYPGILIQAQRVSNKVHGFKKFDFECYAKTLPRTICDFDELLDDIIECDYESFNEKAEEHLCLGKDEDKIGPILEVKLTYLFRNVMPDYHFYYDEDGNIKINAND